ncbi:hypothetical protein HFTV1-gp62 [Haloferax tailed virus 1]|uniref:Uncharacterized protein n=1 Tax=Haloferax tailed virus 1 TaxID=2507575 RepID=A0A410N735_HFTV1|nr:hypothetical protein M1M17_gp62 [Haloferax tailed virus 1]QAS68895.1 hypothetical protein HFTV1-gp62 [Haloferax tailed virus 1]
MEAHEIEVGDTVRVDIKNNAPIGGATQLATFTVKEKSVNAITGVDESWGDECTISGWGTDSLHYKDGGKSGDIVEVRVMETTDDGVPIHGSGTVVA